ncbi:hypothetical protein FA15DRAFT_567465, partial [Coprinopsis marcescibilis]
LEPDELWKSEMKKRIDANLEELLKDARLTYEQKVDATGPREEERRGELYYDYLQAVQDLRSWARDEYAGALERERKEIEWCRESGAEVPVGFVDEAQKEEQYLMLDAFRRMTEARLGGSRPETDESGVSSAESSVIFTPPQRSESVLSSAESSIIFTPERSVIDEEIRLKAEKHAEQQEEFRRRAEGIKKSVMQRKPTSFSSFSASSFAASATSSQSATPTPTPPVSQMSQEDMMRIFIFHDQQWMRITQLSAFPVLHFGDFPWPLLSFGAPRGVGELGVEGVEGYMFGAFGICREDLQKTKERVREHMKKWSCSERFENVFLKRVPEEGGEREMVRKGAALVVAHLNEILGRF